VSAGGKYGQWAFLPVTDGKFLQKRPSEQLLAGQVNGLRILSGVSISLLYASELVVESNRV
jgi:hypothetical protein